MQRCDSSLSSRELGPTFLEQALEFGDKKVGESATNALAAFVLALPIALIGVKVVEFAAYTVVVLGVSALAAGAFLGREEASKVFDTFASTMKSCGTDYFMPLAGRVQSKDF